jgi:hypothetical protein
MKKHLVFASSIMAFLAPVALSFGASALPVSATAGSNLISDSDLSSFAPFLTKADIAIPVAYTEDDFGYWSVMNANNSQAHVTYLEGVGAVAKLQYDGTSTGDNSNFQFWNTDIKKGVGTYHLSFELLAEGLSTGDFIGWQYLGGTYLEGHACYNLSDYTALTDSTIHTGWKHYETDVVVPSDGSASDTIAINLYNRKNTAIVCYVDNLSFTFGGTELMYKYGRYVGDFSCYYPDVSTGFPLTYMATKSGWGSLAVDSPAHILQDGTSYVLKLSYADKAYSSFFKLATFPSAYVGVMSTSFDLKYPDTYASDNLGWHYASASGISSEVQIASSKAALDALPASSLTGYKHYNGAVYVNGAITFDSLALYLNTMSSASTWVELTNFSVKTEDLTSALYLATWINGQAAGSVTSDCASHYETAKAAYAALSETERNAFQNGTDAVSLAAQARYVNWCTANGDNTPYALTKGSSAFAYKAFGSEDSLAWGLLAGLGLVALATVTFITLRHHKKAD